MPEPRQVSLGFVRRWAIRKGYQVGTRGHLPHSVIEAFNKAHSGNKYAEDTNPSVVNREEAV